MERHPHSKEAGEMRQDETCNKEESSKPAMIIALGGLIERSSSKGSLFRVAETISQIRNAIKNVFIEIIIRLTD